jgi:DNA-binding NtrC family response regulator
MTQGAHILVVDDEVNIRGALVTLLEKKGHRVRGPGQEKKRWKSLRPPRPIW